MIVRYRVELSQDERDELKRQASGTQAQAGADLAGGCVVMRFSTETELASSPAETCLTASY
jgi:hypothetical protein